MALVAAARSPRRASRNPERLKNWRQGALREARCRDVAEVVLDRLRMKRHGPGPTHGGR